MTTLQAVLDRLNAIATPETAAGMARYGIKTDKVLGISIYDLRKVAKEIGVDHGLALQLWETGYSEARILASYIEDPQTISDEQLEAWVKDFDSWEICDQVSGIFEQGPYAYRKVFEWSEREEEFVRRAAFAIIAGLVVHDKEMSDERVASFFPVIVRESIDGRNFVKKAVNWALRNIGKRNLSLNHQAQQVARQLLESESKSARWIGRDALRELTSEKVQKRLSG
jgi:3-methyladenine DNA glycosylase AlkD